MLIAVEQHLWCVRCQERREIEDAFSLRLPNGRRAFGCGVCVMVKREGFVFLTAERVPEGETPARVASERAREGLCFAGCNKVWKIRCELCGGAACEDHRSGSNPELCVFCAAPTGWLMS